MLSWTLTDRAPRVFFWLYIIALGTVMVNNLQRGVGTVTLVVALVVFGPQAWMLALRRDVRVEVDEHHLTKQLGRTRWTVAWDQVEGVEVVRLLGSWQLILTAPSHPLATRQSSSAGRAAKWGLSSDQQADPYSDKLMILGRLRRGGRWWLEPGRLAVQVPEGQLTALRAVLASRGLLPLPHADQ